ncbi:hypothetical protein HPB52_008573 [Rhipicephalus sanguineus]|uniref:Uncharacterized protein n=1 Tax=Rhipicephalus sanguineus TaxID=34632 RepID=A0A9D4QHE9_RHISA|nr:hypothetical protein HPB52_008573 [Rhipicephalus sanguineus]
MLDSPALDEHHIVAELKTIDEAGTALQWLRQHQAHIGQLGGLRKYHELSPFLLEGLALQQSAPGTN